jgi:hypothetical protein
VPSLRIGAMPLGPSSTAPVMRLEGAVEQGAAVMHGAAGPELLANSSRGTRRSLLINVSHLSEAHAAVPPLNTSFAASVSRRGTLCP